MSLSNVVIKNDCALVAVDTRGRLADGRFVDCGKALLLPHMNAIITIRGFSPRLAALAQYAVGYMGSFDDFLDELPDNINAANKAIDSFVESLPPGAMKHIGNDSYIADVVCAGYSDAAQGFIGRQFRRTERGTNVQVGAFQERCIAPSWPGLVFPGIDDDLDALKMLSAEQCRLAYQREGADYPIGGRLIVFELRKGSMRTVGEFALPTPT